MLHVDLPIDTQVTSELSPNNCWTIFHSYNDRMCAPNNNKKGNKAFSYLFRTHLLITISVIWCQSAWVPCQEWKFFFIRHELHVNG